MNERFAMWPMIGSNRSAQSCSNGDGGMSSGDDLTVVLMNASSIVTRLNSTSVRPEYRTLENVNLYAVRRLAAIM